MDRLACVIIPDVALQIVQGSKPEWRADAVAVVPDEGPHAQITHVNERALAMGVAPGMRYAAALALAPRLRAGLLSRNEIAVAIEAATQFLRLHSPEVEPSADEPGVFLVNVSGLDRVYASHGQWAGAVRAGLARLGLRATITVGFSRFGTYAAAASSTGIRIFETPQQEEEAARRVPLRNLRLPDEPATLLSKLGVENIAALLRLPREGLLRRFGPEVHQLHKFAAGDLWRPLRPSFQREVPRVAHVLDSPEAKSEAVLFLIKRALPELVAKLAERGEAVASLEVHLLPEGDHEWRRAQVRPASPTRDHMQLLDLVRLHMERMAFSGRIVEISLEAHGASWTPDAGVLLPEHPRRDLAAGRRALARLRAALGESAVVRARLRDGHLPEASFAWEPVEQIVAPRPCENAPLTLVRRIWARPVPLGPGPHEAGRAEASATGPIGPPRSFVQPLGGPYIVSGGWWVKEVHREYHFAETRDREVLWVYFDRIRQKWFAQGRVE